MGSPQQRIWSLMTKQPGAVDDGPDPFEEKPIGPQAELQFRT
jgi:hypothetical protein